MDIINPANDSIITSITEDSIEVLSDKIDHLRLGQKDWAIQTVKHRLECIVRFGELVLENVNELATILTEETGKPIQQSINEIKGAQNRIEHLKLNAEKWLAEEVIEGLETTYEKIIYEPLGVICNISAWNFPYNVGYNVFLYALVAGNAVAYKPSEYATLTGLQFQKLLYEAGVPENVFHCIIGGAEVGEYLLESDFDGYFFTGSHKTGQYIAKKVAHKLVPVQLELGGKDPLYVMEDVADVKIAAINAAEGAFYNNGQSCCALERIYVHAAIYDEFVKELVKEVNNYKMGDPLDKETFIGPLTRKAQLPILQHQVEDALTKGGVLMTGGTEVNNSGNYFEPTVFKDANHEMKLMREESFGPIIGIQKVNNDEQAIDLMKDSEYGLTSAVFSTSRTRADHVFDQMNSGTVYWNCCDRVSPNVPWSGRKNSGLGATLSVQGIRAFTLPKAYHWREV
ncbi:aldehyde dehydrogenase family protein [Flammeovirga kamogawensis]|uniref:Aldehyde dehydrogenase family protein n=1 Tax=Flammeovirga kamogawensis TaxID=373891 RepID=A0ABX8GYB1_9BACT|nr:aldehyde dehydrogenase family protein [Flammeovirga kamogawensis]MBB6458956.1 acyl-CoA reductase-like NAD-dependent aldehyde dehydrogenase [Flammeovirga kamogawensis]QWG08531.1 aldehyde dehydrogenase family protein [Flammeovirga kamogawensis]TRX66824.1 aldehyde dehydrogenase family protein [Flammeovirga kamogawensis]